MRYCFKHLVIVLFDHADRCRIGLAMDGMDVTNPCNIATATVVNLETESDWRLVCAHNHSGPPHIQTLQSRAMADKILSVWESARSTTTQKYCLPMRMETRHVSEWIEVEDAVQQD